MRTALMERRNAIESVFSSVEHRGFALRGQWHSKWACTADEIRSIVGGGVLELTHRSRARETGAYAEALAGARERGLVLV